MIKSHYALAIIFSIVFSPSIFAHNQKHENHHRHNNHHKHHKHAGYGKVVFVKPIYEVVRVRTPYRDCSSQSRQRSNATVEHRHAPERIFMGGLLGGIVGHELGNSHNRELATVAGVIIGSAIAHDTSPVHYRSDYSSNEHGRTCRRVSHITEQRNIVGYKVKYKYRGDIYTTRTSYHPGKRIRIKRGYNDRHNNRHRF